MIEYTPVLPNPYPVAAWSTISDIRYPQALHLCRAISAVKGRIGEDADYVVSQAYDFSFKLDDVERTITVPRGMLTDLSSVPSLLRSIVNRVGPHLEASIVHDFLYIAWQDVAGYTPKDADRDFADELMRVAMIEAKVSSMQVFLIHTAVRAGGKSAFFDRDDGPRYVRDENGGDCPCEGAPLAVPPPPPPDPNQPPSSDPDPGNAGGD